MPRAFTLGLIVVFVPSPCSYMQMQRHMNASTTSGFRFFVEGDWMIEV